MSEAEEPPLQPVLDALDRVAVAVLDADGRVVTLNTAAEELYYCTRSAALGGPWPPYASEGMEMRLAAAAAEIGGVCHFQQQRRRSDCSSFAAECALRPLERSGRARYCEISRDAGAEDRSERYLRESERRLSQILEDSGDGLLVFSPDGRLQFLNRAAIAHLGLPATTALGTPHSALQVGDDHTIIPFMRVVRTGEPHEWPANLNPWGGSEVSIRAVPHWRGRELDSVVVHVADLTGHSEALRHEEAAAAREHLARRLLEAQEEERRALARELHDEVGQQLTGCLMRLEQAGIQDGDVLGAVRGLIERVRGMSLDLRPAILDDLGVLPAVLWLLDRLATTTGLQVELQHRGMARRFEAEVETAVYRVVQEALTNVVRHSQVRKARALLHCESEWISISIADEGCGAAPGKLEEASRGVRGMRERVELLGGGFVIHSAPGKGTEITVSLPVGEVAS